MTREDEVTDLKIPVLAPPIPYELRNMVERGVAAWREGYRGLPSPAVDELTTAIVDGRLRVAYQPIVDLLDHRTVAVEALIRLDDPESPGLANPPAIIDVAESTGLIGALGTHVLTTSCAQLAQWRRVDAPDLQMHVNVSALELRDPGYLDVVNRILRVCQLPANSLVLEITETAALERQGTSQRNLLALSSQGIEVALDDFGTGFASLDLLAATPTRKLKLDRSFIASVGADDDAVRGRGVIVQAAIGMGRSLGLDIVGEGIETQEQARTLLAWGCQYGQGFLFSRAVPPEELDLADDTAPRASALARTIDSGRLLSPEAAELALALRTVLSAADPGVGKLRQLAASAARVIADTVGDGRKHVETSVLLAGIADAPERLAEFVHDIATTSMAAREVLHLLRIPPVIGRRTPPGAIARTAWALASARHAGDEAYDPVLLAAHPDPAVDARLRERIDRWWKNPVELDRTRLHEGVDEHFRGRDDAATRLRAFIGLARAISSTGTVDEMLDLAAEEARRVLGATSLSISRWEHERGLLRTLINVGELAEWEERYPSDEVYDLADYAEIAEQLHAGGMTIESLTGPMVSEQQRQLLERLGRGSGASVPIIVEQQVWGELYVTSAIGEPPYTAADGPYLSAVAGFVGIAISRAEDVGRLARMIHEDPLTRIANRRRIEEHVNQHLNDPARDTPLALLMIDVEGLKHINDEFGHTAGDELLVRVADTLQRAAVGEPHAVAGRLGGDEFCLAMTGDGEQARRLMERIQERLSTSAAPQPRLSVGIAVNHGQPESFRDLLERADTAQYAAKRRGLRVVLDREVEGLLSGRADDPDLARRGGPRDAARQQLVGISEAWVDQLERPSTGTRDHLVALGELAVTLLDLNRWTLSVVPPGTTELRIDGLHLRRARPLGPAPVPVTEEIYDLADFPATVAAFETGELAIDVDDPDADPAERAILAEHGLRYVIGVLRSDPDGTRWLLELYGDDQSLSLRSGRPLVAALREATFSDVDRTTST